MAYDEALAARVKEILSARSDIAERKMFGGLAFMLAGNMCCCVTDKGLMVRVGPEGYEEALMLPHAGIMDITGRPMRGWVLVEPAGFESDASLKEWVTRGAGFAVTLPAK
ncbi:MAG: TfoX/Sxy family protein [Chloroflexota bacterium]|nr:TfoX/Sxy family protein [Chloroflexota bacterium]MDE2962172.1 TfoX/Sxy family protein [Chloroflexota bacterium]